MALRVQITTTKNPRVAVRCPRCLRVLVSGDPAGSFQIHCRYCTTWVVVSDQPLTAAPHGHALAKEHDHADARRI